MTAIAHLHRLTAPREMTVAALGRKFAELNRILGQMEAQVREMRGLAGRTAEMRQGLDLQGHRLQGVGRTRHEGDVPSVRELREEALYARNGIHETERLILAKGGVRTVTPAIAPDDLISKGQVESLIELATGVSVSAVSLTASALAVTTMNQALAYPQALVTLALGENHDVAVGDAVFVRVEAPGDFTVTGLADPTDGRVVFLYHATAFTMTLADEHAGSVAAQRIATHAGGDITMAGRGVVTLLYDTADARWLVT